MVSRPSLGVLNIRVIVVSQNETLVKVILSGIIPYDLAYQLISLPSNLTTQHHLLQPADTLMLIFRQEFDPLNVVALKIEHEQVTVHYTQEILGVLAEIKRKRTHLVLLEGNIGHRIEACGEVPDQARR